MISKFNIHGEKKTLIMLNHACTESILKLLQQNISLLNC